MKFVTRNQLSIFLDLLAQDRVVIAPVAEASGTYYREVKESSQIDWDFTRPDMPVKEFFFPPTERLLEIETHKSVDDGEVHRSYSVTETYPSSQQVLFGVRPCDARGLRALDALFLQQEPVDPYYQRRRVLSTIIGVACDHVLDSCFCTVMGGSPDERRDVDVLLHVTSDGYIVDLVTSKGEDLFEGLQLDPWEGELPGYQQPEHWSLPEEHVLREHFDDPYWQSMAERCLSCRVCAYVCPTCRCFDVRDEPLPSGNGQQVFERIRYWDSCARPGYRAIAGGHNPRAEKGERLRNRFACKLFYFEDQYGASGCTGCGRCVDLCPVNIDITEVIRAFAEKQGALS
jgi:sulfhydrogenase subunit beta (sulfur reductase)